MPYIMNALDEKVQTQAHGKYFTFQPGEIKQLHNASLAQFISQYRGEDGLVEVQDETMELDKKSPEYLVAIADRRKEGIKKYVAKQNFIIRNLEMSLRRDYETSGQKGNFLFEASKGELQAYKNLKKYKGFEAEEQLNIADEIQKAREDLYGVKPEAATPAARPSPLEPAKHGK